MIDAVTSLLANAFLNPIGLLALLTLIPLAYFYLTKPEPDRLVMPSIDFFMEDEKEGKLNHAFNTLRKNIVLILNILFIILAASAVAGLHTSSSGTDETVIIYDRSASMHEEHAESVSTVLENAGSENVIVDTGEQIHVEEGLNRQDAADYIRNNPPENEGSDLRTALQRAEAYEGQIILLSNLDEDQSLIEDFELLAENRGLEQIDYSSENHWGFVDISEDYAEIRNYRNTEVSIDLQINSDQQEVEIPARETRRIDLELDEGENILELPQDGFSLDNTAYVYVPEDEVASVEIKGPENPYIETAIDLMDNFENSNEGDILIMNEDADMPDRPAVFMQGSSDAWSSGSSETKEVQVEGDINFIVETEVYEANETDETFSEPEHALFRDGDKFYYNIDDEDFRQEFVYPVFWQNMLEQITERNSFEDANFDLNSVEETEPGFYNNEYAVNFLDEQQADLEFNEIETSDTEFQTPLNQASILAMLLLVLIGLETILLLDRGVYE